MERTTKFETGAQDHVINDLILFADNTKELAAFRDKIYLEYHSGGKSRAQFMAGLAFFLNESIKMYKKEFPGTDPDYLELTQEQKNDFINLYASDFKNWVNENCNNLKLTVTRGGELQKIFHNCIDVFPALRYIQANQSHSFDWAYRYEGWRIAWEDTSTGESGEVKP